MSEVFAVAVGHVAQGANPENAPKSAFVTFGIDCELCLEGKDAGNAIISVDFERIGEEGSESKKVVKEKVYLCPLAQKLLGKSESDE